MSKYDTPFLGVYESPDGTYTDLLSQQQVTADQIKPNMVPFYGRFYDKDGVEHDIRELGGGGGGGPETDPIYTADKPDIVFKTPPPETAGDILIQTSDGSIEDSGKRFSDGITGASTNDEIVGAKDIHDFVIQTITIDSDFQGLFTYFGSQTELNALTTAQENDDAIGYIGTSDNVESVWKGLYTGTAWQFVPVNPPERNGMWLMAKHILGLENGVFGIAAYKDDGVNPKSFALAPFPTYNPDEIDITFNENGKLTLAIKSIVTSEGNKEVLNDTDADGIAYDNSYTIKQKIYEIGQDYAKLYGPTITDLSVIGNINFKSSSGPYATYQSRIIELPAWNSGVDNEKIDIIFGKVALNGNIRLSYAGQWISVNGYGKIQKSYDLALSVTGTVNYQSSSYTYLSSTKNYLAIRDEFRWDATLGWYITIAKRTNQLRGAGVLAIEQLALTPIALSSVTIGAVYTTNTEIYPEPVLQTEGKTIAILDSPSFIGTPSISNGLARYSTRILTAPQFTGADNEKVDLIIGSVFLWDLFELTLFGYGSPSTCSIRKSYDIHGNTDGPIYYQSASYTHVGRADFPYAISDVKWNSTNGFYVTIAALTPTTSTVSIKIETLSTRPFDISTIRLGTIYTSDTSVYPKPVLQTLGKRILTTDDLPTPVTDIPIAREPEVKSYDGSTRTFTMAYNVKWCTNIWTFTDGVDFKMLQIGDWSVSGNNVTIGDTVDLSANVTKLKFDYVS